MNVITTNKSSLTSSGLAFAAALSGAVSIAGCATTGSSNSGNLMNSSQLEALFSQPLKGTYVTSKNGSEFDIQYQPDGTTTLSSSAQQDRGYWRIHNNQYCAKWNTLRDGEESCFNFTLLSPDIYLLSNSDGDITGKFTVDPDSLTEDKLNAVFYGTTFIGGDLEEYGWTWTFREDGKAVSETNSDWPDQSWAIEGDLLCRTLNGERPCVTVYRFGGLYQLGLQGSEKRESWWIHPAP